MKTKVFVILLLLTLGFPLMSPGSYAQVRKAILVVGDRSDSDMTQREEALKKYLVHYRQSSGNNASTLPIFVYDYNNPKVREYCEKKLGIYRQDLLFLGIVTANGNVPEKVFMVIRNPQNLEENAKNVVAKFPANDTRGDAYITSTPDGAKVWMGAVGSKNAEYKGKTPLKLSGIQEGEYVLTLVKLGYTKTRQTVYIKNGAVANVAVSLPSEQGALALESEPSGASIYINGTYYGETPKEIDEFPQGEHKVVMKKDGQEWRGKVMVSSGKTSSVKGTFETRVVINTPTPTPTKTTPTPEPTGPPVTIGGGSQGGGYQGGGGDTQYTPPTINQNAGTEVKEAFIPKSESNEIFQVTVTNLEEVTIIKDYYKPKPGFKFVLVYVSQQNVSNAVQIYTGKLCLIDQSNHNYEYLENLSNYWLVVLRPGGMNMGYLVFEIPEDAKSMSLVLQGLNMAPLSVSLQ